MVPGPYASAGGKIVATGSLRDDPLGRRYAHRHIDDAQYRIGPFLPDLFKLAEIDSVQAIDPPVRTGSTAAAPTSRESPTGYFLADRARPDAACKFLKCQDYHNS